MKKILLSLLLTVCSFSTVLANSEGMAWDRAPNKTNDVVSLNTLCLT